DKAKNDERNALHFFQDIMHYSCHLCGTISGFQGRPGFGVGNRQDARIGKSAGYIKAAGGATHEFQVNFLAEGRGPGDLVDAAWRVDFCFLQFKLSFAEIHASSEVAEMEWSSCAAQRDVRQQSIHRLEMDSSGR